MNNETFNNMASSLSFEAGIDFTAATKVINWLITEGVLETSMVTETFAEPTTTEQTGA